MNKDIYEILKTLQIPFEEKTHPAVYTCEQADQYYKDVPGGRSKNLFLRDKNGKKHFLVIMESEKKLDMKGLAKKLSTDKISFASEQRLQKYLGLTPGAVSPFGLIHDTNKEVIVVVDSDLWKYDHLHYHPNVNTATLILKKEDFQKFLDWCGNEVRNITL